MTSITPARPTDDNVRPCTVMLAGLILGLAAPLQGQDAAWYSRVVERDLTGDGQREILEVRAVGETSGDLTITFRVIADGRDVYATEWDSRAYFTDDDSGGAERRDARVRSALAEFFDRGFALVTHTHPFMGTPLPEAWSPNPDSDDPREWIARELGAAGRGDVDAEAVTAIWDEMVGRGALGFSFSTGGQERRRIAWSPRLGRFLVIWSCC